MKKYCRSSFTLVEIIAAMGIFCILLLVSMQIFAGSQTIWTSAEKKNNIYATARTSMEFIAARIQSHAYTEDSPFRLYRENAADECYNKIWFSTAMPMNRKDENGKDRDRYDLRFLGFQLIDPMGSAAERGELQMWIYSDCSESDYNNFINLFPPYTNRRRRGKVYANLKAAINAINSKFQSGGVSGDHNKVVIAENVIAFRLRPYNADGTGSSRELKEVKHSDDGDIYTPPYLVEVEIEILDSAESFELWRNASGSDREDIVREHGHTFRRAILLGDQRRL